MNNPYPNRPHPVGRLEYHLDPESMGDVKALGSKCMLEFGEAELLYDIPRLIGGGMIANLGHAQGGSALLMASAIRRHGLTGKVVSVDLFVNKNAHHIKRRFEDIKNLGLEKYVDLHHLSTVELGERLFELKCAFNFVFIDADHSYEGVKKDYKVWSRLIVVGGCIGFHDTNQEFSHKVLAEEVLNNPTWQELKSLHINRVRVFRKIRKEN